MRKLHTAFAARGVDVCEFNLEVDLAGGAPMPSFDVCVILTHDWPTIHEDPAWAAEWLRAITSSRLTVPGKHQILWLFEKTRYVADILSAFPEGGANSKSNMMLPTFFVDADTNLDMAATWAVRNAVTPGKLVTKENFSAGKEGVKFVSFTNTKMASQKLAKIRCGAGVVVSKKGNRIARARNNCGLSPYCCAERTAADQNHKDGFEFVHRVFKGGNKHVLMVQQYEKRFLTEPEKRLFFCRGEFLYAMGYRGWIDTNSTPTELVGECIARELAQVERLLTALTRLSRYALVRFDFGPDALLSEIEVLPDMFGGPSGNIAGERWEKIVDTIAEAYVAQIVSGTTAVTAAAGVELVGAGKDE